MIKMKKGFTLIEVLVVVLIIGILAAVALPQYQKAVERSRMIEVIQRLGDYATAQQVYYLHNSHFASNYTELNRGDIRVPEQNGDQNPWNVGDSLWNISPASGGNLEKVTMSAIRTGGIYEECLLTLSVAANGNIEKTCSGNADCCTAAQASGYGEAAAGTGKQLSSNSPVYESSCEAGGSFGSAYYCYTFQYEDGSQLRISHPPSGPTIFVQILDGDVLMESVFDGPSQECAAYDCEPGTTLCQNFPEICGGSETYNN